MARTDLNRRLTTTDASFLYTEKPSQPMHIGSCNVYEGRLTADDLIGVLNERLHRLTRYRQKVVFPPFGVAHPTWEDDPSFDVRNHVEEIDLPAPGDDRTLSQVGGRVFSQALDRNRPLWKLVLLHGHESGNTMMLAMVHHAMVDGMSGVELQMVLHDLTPHPEPESPQPPWQPEPSPDPLSLMQDAVKDRLTELAKLWTDETFRPWRPADAGSRLRQVSNAVTSSMPYMMQPAPRTPFNGVISAGREFAWVELSFGEIRGIRGMLGGTVNDVVLAILSGALGRYLRLHGERTDPGLELRAMCPVSVRSADGKGALGNQVSMMIAPLYVGILDPRERLNAERAAMERLKGVGQAEGLHALTAMADMIPPSMQAFAMAFDAPNTLLNTVSTNVPGPQIPMYCAGHKMEGWYPLGPCAANIGLFTAILSYNQKLTFGFTVDPKLVPDVWTVAACLRESFEELRDLAQSISAAEQQKAARETEAERGALAAAGTTPVLNGAGRRKSREKEPALSSRGR